MCGIFAYIGTKDNAAELVLNGLKTLEYRGYDSWGIAAKVNQESGIKNHGDTLIVEKHVGKIGNAALDSRFKIHDSSLAIGHTRWATHGGVTDINAHPHLDCTKKIAVVHNGIVENSVIIKKQLHNKGHKFTSETDTEIISHLIEEKLKNYDFFEAVKLSFEKLHGLNAIVAIDTNTSEIVAAKNGSPLVIGQANDGVYLASDVSAIIPYTQDVIFIDDNQIVKVAEDIEVYDLKTSKRVKKAYTKITWKVEQADKGKYEHFLLKEINEQPHILQAAATLHKKDAEKIAKLIKKAKGTFMLGCGTASYAALAGTYLFSNTAKEHVNFCIGSEFKYLEDYINSKSLVIPISQSGETIDVIEPVITSKTKKATIAAIVNVMGSSLYRLADQKFLLSSGPEKAVISTKAFISMYSLLLLSAYALANKTEIGQELLLKASYDTEKILKNTKLIQDTARKLKDTEHLFIIGRGLSYVAALEASLKLKETAYIHAEGFAGGELKHGVIALIEKGTPCIVMAPNDDTFEEIISNAQQIKSRGGFIIGIGPKNDKTFDIFLKTDDMAEATFISQVVIIQLLAYYLALLRGNKDPDKPRNLAKSVTVK